MLKIITSISQIRYSQLTTVYEQSNLHDAKSNYPSMDINAALLYAQQDFYHYLKSVFFQTHGAAMAVWVSNDQYVSALRYEPFEDGLLITGLETAPTERRQGYAQKLLTEVVRKLSTQISQPIYSHIDRSNHASLVCHSKCGFRVSSKEAVFLDGCNHTECITMVYDSNCHI